MRDPFVQTNVRQNHQGRQSPSPEGNDVPRLYSGKWSSRTGMPLRRTQCTSGMNRKTPLRDLA
ncbi:MAG: hypothetical protein MRJ52_10505 [Nitrosomonas sp.]|nr:hypothetical protein [Nitrosomonas sp.]